MRLLVTGAGGQLARDVIASTEHDVVALTRADLDVSDESSVAAVIADLAPQVVCNTAAFTDVDACETETERAYAVNALGPWWLAHACRRVGARLLHLSTDYVFGGAPPRDASGAPRPWSEMDAMTPLSEYGRSKAAGEALIRQTLADHVIVRAAWLAGAHGDNFVKTMLRLARHGHEPTVVDDQVGSPTFTADLAPVLHHLAARAHPGTYHVVNAGRASWSELAVATFELAGIEVAVRRQPSSQLERPAPRPRWSVLDTRHARLSGVPALPPWRDGLRRLLDELEST